MKITNQTLKTNASRASTEDLLNRATVFREGMEPEALAIFEEELTRRGIDQSAIDRHAQTTVCLRTPEGEPLQCSRCHNPAVKEVWGWQRIFFGWLPVFLRRYRYCPEHLPEGKSEKEIKP
jgi:hypothetical protein